MRRSWLAALAVGLLLTTGCGDDDGDGDAATDATDADASSDTTIGDSGDSDDGGDSDDAGSASGPCGAPFQGTISRLDDEMGGQEAAELAGDDIVEAIGASYLGETGYTIYLATSDIDDDGVGIDTITAPDGEAVVTISFQGEGGTVADLEPGDTAGVISMIVDTGGGASANMTGAAGEVTITEINDDGICFDVDYTDEFQTVEGSVSAVLVAPKM